MTADVATNGELFTRQGLLWNEAMSDGCHAGESQEIRRSKGSLNIGDGRRHAADGNDEDGMATSEDHRTVIERRAAQLHGVEPLHPEPPRPPRRLSEIETIRREDDAEHRLVITTRSVLMSHYNAVPHSFLRISLLTLPYHPCVVKHLLLLVIPQIWLHLWLIADFRHNIRDRIAGWLALSPCRWNTYRNLGILLTTTIMDSDAVDEIVR